VTLAEFINNKHIIVSISDCYGFNIKYNMNVLSIIIYTLYGVFYLTMLCTMKHVICIECGKERRIWQV
jgi:hypothetical protein